MPQEFKQLQIAFMKVVETSNGEPFLGRERQLGGELVIGGGKGVEDKGPMQEGRRNAVYRARRQAKD